MFSWLSSVWIGANGRNIMRNVVHYLSRFTLVLAIFGMSLGHLQCGTLIGHDDARHSPIEGVNLSSFHHDCDCTKCTCHWTDAQILSHKYTGSEDVSGELVACHAIFSGSMSAAKSPENAPKRKSHWIARAFHEFLHRNSIVIQV